MGSFWAVDVKMGYFEGHDQVQILFLVYSYSDSLLADLNENLSTL